MYTSNRIYFLIGFIIFLSGCSIKKVENISPSSDKKQKKEQKKKITEIKKPLVKVKKVKKKPAYKYCIKHKKVMQYAFNYVFDEFNKGYFLQKDVIGAKAQVFLVENKSPTPFAQNINAAQESYLKEYKIAKKNGCNVRALKITPLEIIKKEIVSMEKNKAVKR